MKGFPISFNIYAESEQDALAAEKEIKAFITAQAKQGRAVTAKKIAQAVRQYKDSFIVNAYFQ